MSDVVVFLRLVCCMSSEPESTPSIPAQPAGVTPQSLPLLNGSRVLDAAVFSVLGAIFLKNYWVSEDAYLNFRSVLQLMAGNGPIWNPHERVQVFTSPLWFWSHALAHLIVREAYLAVFLLSCLCFGVSLFWLRRSVGSGFAFSLAGLLLVTSNAVFDYTSSGQENVLGYAVLLYVLYRYLQLEPGAPRQGDMHALHGLFGGGGLLLVVRHDLAVLIAPLWIYAAWSRRSVIVPRMRLPLLAAAATPLVLWSMFSLFYYGSAFPNPAYAKLSAGFERSVHIHYGIEYLSVLARRDAASVVWVAAALGLLIWQRKAASAALASAIVLHTCYVVYVGGDYMQGRFVSYEVLLCCALIARAAPWYLEGSVRALVPLVVIIYAFAYPRTPLNTSLEQPKPERKAPERAFVMDARHTLGMYTSLYSYLRASDLTNYPQHPLAIEGRAFARSNVAVTVVHAAGMFGWAAGTEKIVIEAHGISDPLLARLPASAFRGVGHYARYRPEGYIEGLTQGKVQLADAELNQYYEKLALITQSPLWSWQRLQTITLFNFGVYDPLLRHFAHEKILGHQQLPKP